MDGSVEREFGAIDGAMPVAIDWSKNNLLSVVFERGDGTSAICSVSPDEENAAWTNNLDFKGVAYGLAFAPDGKEVVFVGKTGEVWSIHTAFPDGGIINRAVADVRGRTPPPWHSSGIREFMPTLPRYSPDGGNLLYESGGRVYVVAKNGAGPADITPDGLIAGTPSWSPDGDWIAFHAYKTTDAKAGMWNIYVMDPEGKSLRRVTKGGHIAMCPEWSP
ncbi:MAG: TolB family protein [Planctomycetota bacterium]